MRCRITIAFIVLSAAGMISNLPAHAQQDQPESRRKIVSKVVPNYPSLAQKMRIAGSVKVEAVVAPNGTVKSASILGGHPVLAQAGVDAVRRYRFEAAPNETRELIILIFHPD